VIQRAPILIRPGRYENGLPQERMDELLAALDECPLDDQALRVLEHGARRTWEDPGFDLQGSHQRSMAADVCRLVREVRRLRGAK
jgi:hypothetical protein